MIQLIPEYIFVTKNSTDQNFQNASSPLPVISLFPIPISFFIWVTTVNNLVYVIPYPF